MDCVKIDYFIVIVPYNSVKPKKAVKTDEDVLKKTIEQFTNTQLINDYKPLNFNDMEYVKYFC